MELRLFMHGWAECAEFMFIFSIFLLILDICQYFASIPNGCCTSAVYFITDHYFVTCMQL